VIEQPLMKGHLGGAALAVVLTISGQRQTAAADPPDKQRSADEAAILQVIERQSAARAANDFERWASDWSQVPYARRIHNTPTGEVICLEGWDAIAGKLRQVMSSNVPQPASNRGHYNVRVRGDAAFVTFDQRSTGAAGALLSRETRFLERLAGNWKVVYMGSVVGPEPTAVAPPPPPRKAAAPLPTH
jgi:ketosteroid isomerase-like protein